MPKGRNTFKGGTKLIHSIFLALLIKGMLVALRKVIGTELSKYVTQKIREIIDVDNGSKSERKFNYRQFVGIAAYVERVFFWNKSKEGVTSNVLVRI